MRLKVSASGVRVHDADDLSRMDVHSGLTDDELDRTLRDAELGELAGTGAVVLHVPALRSLARARSGGGSGWDERWEQMLSYAAAHGWTAGDGALVRAHVVRD